MNRVLDHHLLGKFYDEATATALSNYILEDLVAGLARLEKPFKYVVNCVLMQNTGAALHGCVAEFVDGMNDGVGTVRWPSDRIKEPTDITAVVTVFGVSLLIGNS